MKISEICIRRPVFATVLSLVIVLLGLVSYTRLSVREYPQIDQPVVSIQTSYRGASAEIVESQVTQVLEDALSGIEDIDFITSSSRQGQSQINITFDLSRDPSSAAADVRDRVGRVRGALPQDVDEPVIQKVESDSQPVLIMSFSSDRMSPMELTDYADRYVVDQFQTIRGVAQVFIMGERRYSMRIWLDAERMTAFGVTPQDVEDSLRKENVEVPAGLVEGRFIEYSVLAETDLRTPEEFNELVIRKTPSGYLVRLIDVGRAEIGPLDERFVIRRNGESAIGLGIVKQATANPVEISDAVEEIMPKIQASLPEGVEVNIVVDFSRFIKQSIRNVYETIAEAVFLVIAIIFFTLRSVRATLIPLVTIPISLIGAIGMMYAFGFSINTLTLLAMVLAIGLVVDDAIVMLENIYRHVEDGMRPFDAAMRGAREMGFAVVAMSLTLASVYLPVAFMGGASGRLFTEFAITLAGAVLISGFVALTASPMMCSLLLRERVQHGRLYRAIEGVFDWVTGVYRTLLNLALKARPVTLGVGAAVAVLGAMLLAVLPTELAPNEDQGSFPIMFIAPEGSTLEYSDTYMRQIEAIGMTVPEARAVMGVIGFGSTVTAGRVFLELVPWDERERSESDIIRAVMPRISEVPGVMAFPVVSPPLGGGFARRPVEVIVQTPQPYSELRAMVDSLMAKLATSDKLTALETDLRLDKPQLKIDVDREKAADLGVDASVLGRTLETLVGGRRVTRFKQEGQQYDVMVRVTEPYRTSPGDLPNIYVRSKTGQLIQIASLVEVTETVAPRELGHFNKLRSATINANLREGVSLGEGLASIQEAAKEVLPETARLEYAGQSREFQKASAEIYVTFGLAIAFIYLVLAAQFESFRSPFVILLTVPLSIAGGLFALWLDGSTLNIYSQVGLITLIGLITKHGILIVEFANHNRENGMLRFEAVIEAAVLRLRPILMTTGAMVFGALPLVLAGGAGAESRQDIGMVIVGGISIGTLFTLFVIPVAYTYLIGTRKSLEAQRERAHKVPKLAE